MTEAEIKQTQQQAALLPGARRKKARLAQTAVMLDKDERRALDAAADELGQSRSALIREAVRLWLKKGRGKRST